MIFVVFNGHHSAIPSSPSRRSSDLSQKNACIANLKQMDGAKATWALEQKQVDTNTPNDTDLFGTTQYIRDKPECPGGGSYTLGNVATRPICSLGATAAQHSL